MICAGPRGYYLLDGIGLCSEVYGILELYLCQ
jgi:hypothetical protein